MYCFNSLMPLGDIMVKVLDDDSIPQKKSELAQGNDVLQAQLVNAILSLPAQHVEKIVQKLMPHIAAYEMRQPRIWGDPSRLILRNTVHINDLLINTRSGYVTIEKDTFFGHRCKLLTGNHNYKKKGQARLKDVPDSGRDIHIKEGAWLGAGATILGPCIVGEHAVIAAGSFVTANEVPPGTIWAGHPAKQVKEIEFDKEE